jgi:anti-sigma B factor antagonist
MEITEKAVDDISILGISGRLDAKSSKTVESALNNLINGGRTKIVVDLASVEYISSVGLRVLLASLKKMRQTQGLLILSSMQPFVKDVFKVAGFDRLFTVCATPEEALSKARA